MLVETPPRADATTAACPSCAPLTGPLLSVLNDLHSVVAGLSDDQYTMRMGRVFANGTIGGHVRHCLDHVRALVEGRASGAIDYDHRERGTSIETSGSTAAAELERLASALSGIALAPGDEPISVQVMPSHDHGSRDAGGGVTLRSTLGRELAFVLSHTIHHNAIIRGMVVSLGLTVPSTLGFAPSTIAHREQTRCAL